MTQQNNPQAMNWNLGGGATPNPAKANRIAASKISARWIMVVNPPNI